MPDVTVAVATRRAACTAIAMVLISSLRLQAEQLPLKLYTSADGLARDQINRIVRDSRGFLWFCTPEGLSRFDGHTFATYSTSRGMPHHSVRDFLETRAGVYWVATGDGLCRLNAHDRVTAINSICSVFRPDGPDGSQDVWRLYEDRSGAIWVGTVQGLFRLNAAPDPVRFEWLDFGMPAGEDNRLIEDILEDRQGSLWVATRASGLYRRRPDGRVERYAAANGIIHRITALAEDRFGNLWAASNDAGIYLLRTDSRPDASVVVHAYSVHDGLPSNWVTALLASSDGTLWVATDRGLAAAAAADSRSLRLHVYTTANGLVSPGVSALAEDRDGNVWLGFGDRGAMKLARNGFMTYDGADGLGQPVVGTIFESRSGDLLLFGEGVVSRFNGSTFERVAPNFPKQVTNFSWGANHTALQDRWGEWWFATLQGLVRLPNVPRLEDLARARPTIYNGHDGLAGDRVFHIFEDASGDLWINSLSERLMHLSRWHRAASAFSRCGDGDGWPTDTWVNAFAQDPSGRIWIGTAGKGLARYMEGRFTMFTTRHGLASNTINGLYTDHLGRLWLAESGGGVQMMDPRPTSRSSAAIRAPTGFRATLRLRSPKTGRAASIPRPAEDWTDSIPQPVESGTTLPPTA